MGVFLSSAVHQLPVSQEPSLQQQPCFQPAIPLLECLQRRLESPDYPLRRSAELDPAHLRANVGRALGMPPEAKPRSLLYISARFTDVQVLAGRPWFEVIPQVWGVIPSKCQIWNYHLSWMSSYQRWAPTNNPWLRMGFDSAWDIISSCLAYREHSYTEAADALQPLALQAAEEAIPLRVQPDYVVTILSA